MPKELTEYSPNELASLEKKLQDQYEHYLEQHLTLNMARGNPCKEQLDLTVDMLTIIDDASKCISGATDIRNYGLLDGIPEMKQIFADLFSVSPDNVICGGNSSLNMMYDAISRAMTFGIEPGFLPWGKQKEVKFLCPVPGYDRHFSICEIFGIKMIPVEMTPDGPDIQKIRSLVENDPTIKGMWCVPKYSNPGGICYSPSTVRALAALHPVAKDFRIFWDNAYAVHDLYEPEPIPDIFAALREIGRSNLVYEFASTSKISFPGSGVACLIADKEDILWAKKLLGYQTIGPDKINQKRHAAYFRDAVGLREHMKKHAAILRPKFETVEKTLQRDLDGLGICRYSHPRGGYFVSFDILVGSAKRVLELAKKAGITMTPAGSTFPYHNDPYDRNIRIAPTYPSLEDLQTAMNVFTLCVRLAAVERLLGMAAPEYGE